MGVLSFFNRAWQGEYVLSVRRHLEEESDGEVWSWPEMLGVFKVVRETVSPRELAELHSDPRLSWHWMAKEPGIGEVEVIRRADGVKGMLYFKDKPRFYFGWHDDE